MIGICAGSKRVADQDFLGIADDMVEHPWPDRVRRSSWASPPFEYPVDVVADSFPGLLPWHAGHQ